MIVARPRTRPATLAAQAAAPSNVVALHPFRAPSELAELTFDGMKALNRRTSSLVAEFRLQHQQWRERVLLYELTASEFVVFTAIVGRTFSWGKMIEAIALDQFVNGMRSKSGGWQETGGLPIFKGTGLDRKTVIKALKSLHGKGLVTRFAYPYGARETSAWAPLSAWTILKLIDHGDSMFAPLIEARQRDTIVNPHVLPLETDFMTRFTQPKLPETVDE